MWYQRVPGCVGVKLVRQDGSLDMACRRSFPTPRVSLYRILGLSRLFPTHREFGRYNLTYLDPDETAEVDAVTRQGAERLEVGCGEKPGADERLEIDQVGIAGERRETLVGRVAEAGGSQGASLPIGEAGSLEEVEELNRVAVEHPDALISRKTGRVEQDPGGAVIQPGEERIR